MRARWQGADWVLAASVTLLVTIFGVFAFLVWQAHGTVLRQAEDRAASAATVVSAQARWLVGGQLRLLDHLAESEAPRIATSAEPNIAPDITIYDANGRPLGEPQAGAPVDLATLDVIDVLKRGEKHAIGSGIADPTIVVASRLSAPNGDFSGAVVSVIPRTALEQAWNALKLGPDSTVSLMRSDGVIVARFPSASRAINLKDQPVFKTLMASPSGTYSSMASPVDGVARVIGFDHVDEIGLVAIAGVSQTAVIDGLWGSVRTVSFLLGPIALALFAGAVLTSRLLRKSEAIRRELGAALAHNEVLFREIHHRVKNNLQSVNAILSLQPIPREIKDEMARRLSAMSAVHEHIYRSDNFGSVDLSAYLATLVGDVRKSAPEVEITDRYDAVRVPSDLATPLGLIVNEVIANCVKHAFPDGRKGLIAITLTSAGAGTAELAVSDNGVGYDPDQPRKGIGQKLITALAKQIGGTVQLSSENGTRFAITFPTLPSATR